MSRHPYVSRGGEKLASALDEFDLDPAGLVCADLGSHVGGFVDCLLQRGAQRVYAVDTAYGLLAWKLRRDPRVVVMERTNAMHAELREPVDLVTIDAGWTPQSRILPTAARILRSTGRVVTLIKPHYEAQRLSEAGAPGAPGFRLAAGVLPDDQVEPVVRAVCAELAAAGWGIARTHPSPLRGHGGNAERFALLLPPVVPSPPLPDPERK